jgi:CheY-like chemotaxis protein
VAMSGMGAHGAPIEILLVDDDPGDVILAREALAEYKVRNHVTVLGDGREAIAFLRREPPFADAVRPDLVLLDLNLPGLDGRAVLEALRADPDLSRVPAAVLTTSRAEQDMVRGFHLGAQFYVTKPVDFEALTEIVRQVEQFAFRVDRAGPARSGQRPTR